MSERGALAWIAAATLVGAALRIAGVASDFWLDEVWTWAIAGNLSGPLEVFTGVHHSNNHHFVTLWVLALGQAAPVWAYRLPSLLAGVATVPLAAALAWRRGRLEAAIAATGVAVCFALVHFASEARGYALAVAFALAAQLALRRDLETGSGRASLLFAACVSLGLLSYLGFAFYWAGAAAQSLWQLRGAQRADAARRLLRLHALPAATLLFVGLTDLRLMEVGGGNPTDLSVLAARTVGFAFGLPVLRSLALPYALGTLAALTLALVLRARRPGDGWIGELVTIVVAPLLTFLLVQPDVIAVRYFLIGIALTLLLFADLLAAGLRAGGQRRAIAIGVGLAFLAGSAVQNRAFLEHGRGGFGAALETMLLHGDPVVRVASDHDFRNRVVLRFHARSLPPPQRLAYVPRGQRVPGGPEWRIVHRAERPARTAATLTDDEGHRYVLFADFDHAAISGFYWALYRNDRSSTTVPKP